MHEAERSAGCVGGRGRWGALGSLVLSLALASGTARAQGGIVLVEVLGSWRGDDSIQFVELQMIANNQNALANNAALVFDDATGDAASRKVLLFTKDVAIGVAGARVLLATAALSDLTHLTPDLVLPAGLLAPTDGRVCYQARNVNGQLQTVDCVAYGDYTGPRDGFGRPTDVTPDNRSLVRIDDTFVNVADWRGELRPTPTNNANVGVTMGTECGDGVISLGEQCDGAELGGATCASLGFVQGKLKCDQCHYSTKKCTFCGNDELNDGEQCDGTDLAGAACEDLGFTGGDLTCTAECAFDTAGCDPTFYVPGAGPKKKDCLAEWLVENAAAKPGANGKAKAVQKCRQGDAGCDFDAAADTCTFRVAVCFRRRDARLPKCDPRAVATWQLKRPPVEDSAAAALLEAVAALGGTVADDTVAFDPVLGNVDVCSAPVALAVPAKKKLKLKAKATDVDGLRDADGLVLVCRP